MSAVELTPKQMQFNAAMELYTSGRSYALFNICISLTNVSLQLYLLYRVLPLSIGVSGQILTLIAAYLLTDFINGLVHLYMDDNDKYNSPAGPLIANFHLHHKVPKYKRNNIFVVYFNESGSKVWLVAYLLAVSLCLSRLPPAAAWIFVYIGILSSWAEVSHYLCHTSNSAVSLFLSRLGLVLSKRHHAAHHLRDNNSYAFLNGFSDPLIDLIAGRFFAGYKQTTDLHYVHFTVEDTDSR